MKKFFLISGFLCLSLCGLFAQQTLDSAIENFQQGNEAYRDGDYNLALEKFRLADTHADGAAINYNLANTYFRLGRIPESILHFERALKFDPADEDIRHNLRMANERIVDRIETIPKSKFSIWWEDFRYGMGPDGWAYITIAFVLAGILALFVFWVGRGIGIRRLGFFVGILFLLIAVISHTLAESAETHRYTHISAIISSDKVDIKSEPRDAGTRVFVLHAGTKVTITGKEDDWYEVEIASGNKGWIKAVDVEEI